MLSELQYKKYNLFSRRKVKRIRWRRTAAEIFNDHIVYEGKACTDLTICFIAFCNAHGIKTKFVKIKKGIRVHSIVELFFLGNWYIYDVSTNRNPVKGTVSKEKPFMGWNLWRKGRDSWDIGLEKYADIRKMFW